MFLIDANYQIEMIFKKLSLGPAGSFSEGTLDEIERHLETVYSDTSESGLTFGSGVFSTSI